MNIKSDWHWKQFLLLFSFNDEKRYPYVLSQLRVCADQGYRFHEFQKHGSDKKNIRESLIYTLNKYV